jgi:predicted kinase
MILIVLCGLPGAGKSRLAEALAAKLDLPVLDKDRVRAALFGPSRVEYSRAQDDHCCELLYATAGWLAARGEVRAAVLDGRTFVRAGQVERLVAVAAELGFEPRFVSCTAPRAVLLERISRDLESGSHPAANRTVAHLEALERDARPLPVPHLVLDTHGLDTAAAVQRVRAWTGL